jgi:hypothetical protein
VKVTNGDQLQRQLGYLALTLSQLCLVVIELGRQAGVPALAELVHVVGAARTYGERLVRS